jgi:hypothetical protein
MSISKMVMVLTMPIVNVPMEMLPLCLGGVGVDDGFDSSLAGAVGQQDLPSPE